MSVVLSTNKSDYHEIAEIVLKVALNTITTNSLIYFFNARSINGWKTIKSYRSSLDIRGINGWKT
jgi:hypothetical protein